MALRYTRQERLVEVGTRGQERLSGLRVRVAGSGLAAEVEALYLAGAGVTTLEVDSEQVAAAARGINPEVDVAVGSSLSPSTGTSMELRAGASEVAEGALRALITLRAALQEAN